MSYSNFDYKKYIDTLNSVNKELNLDFILQKNLFRIDSTRQFPFSLNTSNDKTKSVGGIQFAENGRAFIQADETLIECVGSKIESGSKDIPAKITRAENGDIVLWALNGDVIIQANNIQFRANDANGGSIYMNASKLIESLAPNVKIQAEYSSITSSAEHTTSGSSVSTHGEFANNSTKATDEEKSSLLGKILAIIKKIKKFFTNTCA